MFPRLRSSSAVCTNCSGEQSRVKLSGPAAAISAFLAEGAAEIAPEAPRRQNQAAGVEPPQGLFLDGVQGQGGEAAIVQGDNLPPPIGPGPAQAGLALRQGAAVKAEITGNLHRCRTTSNRWRCRGPRGGCLPSGGRCPPAVPPCPPLPGRAAAGPVCGHRSQSPIASGVQLCRGIHRLGLAQHVHTVFQGVQLLFPQGGEPGVPVPADTALRTISQATLGWVGLVVPMQPRSWPFWWRDTKAPAACPVSWAGRPSGSASRGRPVRT